MSISIKTVEKVSKLARLELPKEKEAQEKLQKELSSILEWVHELSHVDVSGVNPLINPSQLFKKETPVRKDEVREGKITKEILSNAPKKDQNMFVVPKVVE